MKPPWCQTIARNLYYEILLGEKFLFQRKVKMEALKPEVKRQIISEFYETNKAKGKELTFKHFCLMGL